MQVVSHPDKQDETEGAEGLAFVMLERSIPGLSTVLQCDSQEVSGSSSFLRSTSLTTFLIPSQPLWYLVPSILPTFMNPPLLFLSTHSYSFLKKKKACFQWRPILHCPTTIFSLLNSPLLFLLSLNVFIKLSELVLTPTFQLTSDSSWNLVCCGDSTSSLPILLKLLSQSLLVSF